MKTWQVAWKKHIREEPTPPSRIASAIPQELESLVLNMLSRDSEKRLQDMKAIAKVLGKYAQRKLDFNVLNHYYTFMAGF